MAARMPLPAAACQALGDRRRRDDQYRQVHRVRDLANAAVNGTPEQFPAFQVDKVDLARIPAAGEIAGDEPAQLGGVGRGAHDDHA